MIRRDPLTAGPRRSRFIVGAIGFALLALAGCGDGNDRATPVRKLPVSETATTTTTTPTRDEPVVIAPGITLYPGKDGNLPVKVRWVQQLAVPENFYVVDDVVYVSDECLFTLSLFSGEELWRACKRDGNGFFSDGFDEIGPAGPGRIRVWMQYNDNLLIDLNTHSVIDRGPTLADRPPGFKPFPALRDHTYSLEGGSRTTAYDRRGRLAWSIRAPNPLIYPLGPVRTPSGAIIVTNTGLMVSLDYER